MNKCKEIAKLLADGQPRTGDQVRAVLELTRDEFLSAMTTLRLKGFAESVPITYSITKSGKKYAAHVPKSAAARMRKSRDLEAKRQAREESMQAKALETIVSRAVSSRPALQQAWGHIPQQEAA